MKIYDKIIIKDFGPIKHVELEIKEIMIFIGPQATGKSTIAKLIHFFKHLRTYFFSDKANPNHLLSLFKNFFGARSLLNSPNAEIEYISQTNKITLKNKKIHFNTLSQQDYKTILIPAGRAVYSLISDSLFSLTVESVNIDPMILNFGRHIELARKKIADILSKEQEFEVLFKDILKGDFQYINGESRIYLPKNAEEDQQSLFAAIDNVKAQQISLLQKIDEKYITLDRASSGQQEVLPLLLILRDIFYSETKHFVTVEEPEAHLYPCSQYKLIELISRVHNSHDDKNSLIITTHSPYILSAFNNFIFAYQVADLGVPAKVKNVISAQSWINPNKVAAYSVNNGMIKSIINESTQLIAENEIDDASENIAVPFDELLELYQECKHG